MGHLRDLLLEAKEGLEPWETVPDAAVDDIAGRCGAADVARSDEEPGAEQQA